MSNTGTFDETNSDNGKSTRCPAIGDAADDGKVSTEHATLITIDLQFVIVLGKLPAEAISIVQFLKNSTYMGFDGSNGSEVAALWGSKLNSKLLMFQFSSSGACIIALDIGSGSDTVCTRGPTASP